MEPIRIEAEDLDLQGYRVNGNPDFDFISNNNLITLANGASSETGFARTNFQGASGTYDIVIGYFDENDGISNFSLNIDGENIDNFRSDSLTGDRLPSANSFATRVISNQTIDQGDLIELIGTEDSNGREPARIDYIEFLPTSSGTAETTSPNPSPNTKSNNDSPLRILSLGDSIARGEDATTPLALSNGYRDNLQNLLSAANIDFDFVGSRNHGDRNAFDTDHEGHGGFRVNQIINNVERWLADAPSDVILLNIGTNDLRSTNTPVEGIIGQLGNLINIITNRSPLTQLIVSSVPPVTAAAANRTGVNPNFVQRAIDFNRQLPGLVSRVASQGRNVSFADAFGSLNPATSLSRDGFHPNEFGYNQSAGIFFNAIQALRGQGLTPGAENGNPANPTVTSNPTPAEGEPIRIEAEDLQLENYRIVNAPDFDFISNGGVITLENGATGETGFARTNFQGGSGIYDIIIGYFDENDGVASFSLNIDGDRVDSFIADSQTGTRLPSVESLATRVISNQTINTGDLIELIGTEDGNEPARIDYIEFVERGNNNDGNNNNAILVSNPAPSNPTSQDNAPQNSASSDTNAITTTRIEAEDLQLENYRIVNAPDFDILSNGGVITLEGGANNETGFARTNFQGASGTYDILIGYFDENDGAAQFSVNVDGERVDNFIADRLTGTRLPSAESFATRVISNQFIDTGDVVELIGTEHANEPARIDYIEFISTGSGSSVEADASRNAFNAPPALPEINTGI